MDNLINDGLGLMLLGMGFVFVFLILLIIATGFMSKLINQYFPEAAPVAKKTVATPSAAATSSNSATDPKIAAAITAAIHQHRNR